MNVTLLVGILLVVGVIGVIAYGIGTYNTLVRLSNMNVMMSCRNLWSVHTHRP